MVESKAYVWGNVTPTGYDVTGFVDASLSLAETIRESERRWRTATPEQRQQREREAAEQRALERASATPVPFTMEALAAKMGWSPGYAEHLVQPYCTCGEFSWGWDYCEHARDLGLEPS